MLRHSHLLAALTLTFVACHDEAKPIVVPQPEPSASAAASMGPAPAPIVPAVLVITEREITLLGTKVVDLPSDRSGGADPKDKRNGKNDLYLVPLANALATDGGRAVRSIVVDVDDTTPYRLLIEVLFTLGQSEFEHWNLRRRGHAEILPITPPRALPVGTASPTSVALVVFLVDGGISIKTSGGNVAPGCNDAGPGLAIPKRDGAQDYAALGACARRLKSQFPNEQAFTFTASPGLPFAGAWAVIDAVRGAKGEVFPDVMLGVSR